MKILVFIKQVPDTDDVKLDPNTGNLQREGVQSILNPLDANSIECAMQLKRKYGATVAAISILMNVVVLTGGIDLMVAGLSSLMTEKTAAPIMGLTAGIMSWFSTTTSVVMPTLIPTIPGILEKLGGDVNVMQMLSSVVNTSFAAAVSPLSAGGGIVLATYVQLTSCKEEEQSKWFKNLFLIAILCVVLMVIVDALGIYIHI